MKYGNLNSQYSWIKYKKKELNEAEDYIQKAIQYKKLSFQLSPGDWIRLEANYSSVVDVSESTWEIGYLMMTR